MPAITLTGNNELSVSSDIVNALLLSADKLPKLCHGIVKTNKGKPRVFTSSLPIVETERALRVAAKSEGARVTGLTIQTVTMQASPNGWVPTVD